MDGDRRPADRVAVCVDSSVFLASVDPEDPRHHDCVTVLTGKRFTLTTVDLARLEVANVAVTKWHKPDVVRELLEVLEQIGDDGGIVAMNAPLATMAAHLAGVEGLSVYDAAYVIAARKRGCTLVSCDHRDLVSRGLAISPAEVLETVGAGLGQT